MEYCKKLVFSFAAIAVVFLATVSPTAFATRNEVVSANVDPTSISTCTDGQTSSISCIPTDPGKSSWPELVGINGEVAAAIIAKENPYIEVVIVKTMEFNSNRVRIWVDEMELSTSRLKLAS